MALDHTTGPRNLRHCSQHLPPSLHDSANVIGGFPQLVISVKKNVMLT